MAKVIVVLEVDTGPDHLADPHFTHGARAELIVSDMIDTTGEAGDVEMLCSAVVNKDGEAVINRTLRLDNNENVDVILERKNA